MSTTGKENNRVEFAPAPPPPDPLRTAFLEAAAIECHAERALQNEATRASLTELIQTGRGLGPLRIEKTGEETVAKATTRFRLDQSELTSGKDCRIVTQDRKPWGSAEIKKVGKDRIHLRIRGEKPLPTEPVFLTKVEVAFQHSLKKKLEEPGPAWPQGDKPADKGTAHPASPTHRNFRECLELCLGNNPVAAIKGPPGTGKTQLLGWVAWQSATQGKRVLITAQSHAAVETALKKVGEINRKEKTGLGIAKRVTNENTLKPDLEELGIQKSGKLCARVFEGGTQIVGATIAALAATQEKLEADILLVDEAGQVPIFAAAAIAPIGKQMILFGDETQLAPVLLGEHHNRLGCAESAMAFVRKRLPHVTKTLLINHRSNRECVRHTQFCHYAEFDLEAGANQDTKIDPVWLGETKLPECGTHTWKTHHKNRRKHCREEIELTGQLVLKLLESHVHTPEGSRRIQAEDIAILCPHRRQAEGMQHHMEEILPKAGAKPDCGTVHKLQGQGRAVVIYSATASHPSFISQQAEFLFEPSLWNVATSRAAALTIILANIDAIREAKPKTLTGLAYQNKVVETLEKTELSQTGNAPQS